MDSYQFVFFLFFLHIELWDKSVSLVYLRHVSYTCTHRDEYRNRSAIRLNYKLKVVIATTELIVNISHIYVYTSICFIFQVFYQKNAIAFDNFFSFHFLRFTLSRSMIFIFIFSSWFIEYCYCWLRLYDYDFAFVFIV